MKKLFLFFTSILFLNTINSQNNFLINYKVKYVESFDNSVKKNQYDILLKNLSKNFDNYSYSMLIDNYQSLYEPDHILSMEDRRSTRMTSIILGEDLIYLNHKDSVYFRQKYFVGDLYLVKVDFPENQWEITEESKQILSYTCYKAFLKKNNIKNKKVTVTAWFTKEISPPFGPKGYYGLPGTILELQENNILYYASKINLNNKSIIKPPVKGIKITEEELEKKAGEAAHQMFGVKKN